MKETLLQTPEGVRDIYNSECEHRRIVTTKIMDTLHLYGNQDIETPTFEYFNIFNQDTGSAPSSEMYKFFDRNNNTLVMRPDFTPSVARCIAKYYTDETLPIRLCYKGNVFKNMVQHRGNQNETTEIGCELVNDDSSAADAEMIACVIDCLLSAGLKEFQIEIGEVEFFEGLMREAGLDSETEDKIRDLIQMKNFFGLSDYVRKLPIDESMKDALSSLDKLIGGPEMLEHAAAITTNEAAITAIERMKKVYTALSYHGYERYVSFDLSMINGYDYYTGIVYSGYTYDVGNPIVRGGRYNNMLSKFGKDAPSIGFVILVDELMNALIRQGVPYASEYESALVVYTIEHQSSAVRLASFLRKKGLATHLIRKSKKHNQNEYLEYADRYDIDTIYILQDETTVRIIHAAKCIDEERTLDDLEAEL